MLQTSFIFTENTLFMIKNLYRTYELFEAQAEQIMPYHRKQQTFIFLNGTRLWKLFYSNVSKAQSFKLFMYISEKIALYSNVNMHRYLNAISLKYAAHPSTVWCYFIQVLLDAVSKLLLDTYLFSIWVQYSSHVFQHTSF